MTSRELARLRDARSAIHEVVESAGPEDRGDLEAALALVGDAITEDEAEWKYVQTWLTVARDCIQRVLDRNAKGGPSS